MEIKKFNIRVYGIVIYKGRVLLTDEYRMGIEMTKFPGGGLEFGEGTVQCLNREFMEELQQEIDIKEHIYTTDFFQPTKLLAEPQQLISIYYRVELKNYHSLKTSSIAFDFKKKKDGAQSFRWVNLKNLTHEQLTFPIDKRVVGFLQDRYL